MGANQALEDITANSSSTTEINGGEVTTTGDQTYNDPVILGADTTFRGTNVTFNSTVDAATAGEQSLTVNASGTTTFGNEAGDQVGGNQELESLTTDEEGTTVINTDQVNATGDQNYNDPVTLGADTALSGTNVTFNSTVDAATAGEQSLTVNASGTTTFGNEPGDQVGGNQALESLTTDEEGTTVINTDQVTTTEDQTYNDPVTLGADTALSGTNVTFNSTVDATTAGEQSLTVNASGTTTFGNAVGNFTRLGNMTIDSANNFNAEAITAISLTVTASGNIITGDINSGSVSGTGGNITLESSSGEISTGNLNSSGTSGGNIFIDASTTITTGTINSSGNPGNGGNVTLDPSGDIEVISINAQGGSSGSGGNVDITTERFFRATGTFTDDNDVTASISTAGGQGGGDITIDHGGNGETPFDVGDAATNGTAGAITSGEFTIASGSFLFNETEGNISIISGVEPPDGNGMDGDGDGKGIGW